MLRGRIAYWVGDESLKAKINIEAPYQNITASPQEKQWSLTVSGQFGGSAMEGFDRYHRLSLGDRENIFTPEMIALTPFADVDPIKKRMRSRAVFHDVTLYSQGVLSDSRNGGLRKDLTAGLTEQFDRLIDADDKRAEPKRMFDPVEGFSSDSDGGPFWEQLRSFYQLNAEEGSVAVRPQGETEHGIYPVITLFQSFYAPSYVREISSDSASPSYTLYFHLLPVLVLWNPYNVALEATPYTLVFWRNTFPGANEFPYWNQCHPERFRVDAESGPTEASEENPIDTSTRWLPYVFKRKAIFNLPAVAFQPGEAKIFTPAQHSDATDGMILVEGFRPGMSFFTQALTNKRTTSAVEPLYLPSADYDLLIRLSNSRRSALELYAGSPFFDSQQKTTARPLVYIKKLNTQRLETLHIKPVLFEPDNPMVPLLQPIDYHRMYGRKLVLRLPHNQYDSITPPEDRDFFPVDQNYSGDGGHRTKKIKRLANYNPRAPVFGRRPFEFDEDVRPKNGGFGYYNPANYMADLLYSGEGTYTVPVNPVTGNPYIGYSETSDVQRAVLFDIPKGESSILSIGQLMHANLTTYHGGTSDNFFEKQYGLAEFFADNVNPAYAIGNSLADPAIPLNKTFQKWQLTDVSVDYEGYHYDLSYKLNEAFWDRCFFSTVPRQSSLRDTSGAFLRLPNSRLKFIRGNAQSVK